MFFLHDIQLHYFPSLFLSLFPMKPHEMPGVPSSLQVRDDDVISLVSFRQRELQNTGIDHEIAMKSNR